MAYGEIHSPAIPCGTLILDEPRKFRRSYETASWYTEIEAPAGEYEITTNGYWYFVELDGIVTDEHFVNRVFWASSVAEKRNIGKPDSYTIQSYAYDLAKQFVHDPEHYLMLEGWSVKAEQWGGSTDSDDFSRRLSDGKRRVRHSLIPPKDVNTLMIVQDDYSSTGSRVVDTVAHTTLLTGVSYAEARTFIDERYPRPVEAVA